MNDKIVDCARWVALVVCWLLFSPLFYCLSRKWEMVGRKKRIWLSIFSPNLIIIFLLFVILLGIFVANLVGIMTWAYNSVDRSHVYEDAERMERITGIAFPELTLVEYKKGEANWMGDYEDKFVLEMKEDLPELAYHRLDSLIECEGSHWRKSDNMYIYSNMWGNGEPTPDGENPEIDCFLEISLKKGNRTVNLSWGMW